RDTFSTKFSARLHQLWCLYATSPGMPGLKRSALRGGFMRIFSPLALCFITLTALAQSAPDDGSHRLPVKHVVLYKNGVGYFEHDGRVRGNQQVTIDFTTSQLNDVLKSLTAIDLGNGRITDVSYNSTAPLNQRLNSLRLSLGEKTTTAAFLDALR